MLKQQKLKILIEKIKVKSEEKTDREVIEEIKQRVRKEGFEKAFELVATKENPKGYNFRLFHLATMEEFQGNKEPAKGENIEV